jgi:hypothetical protein
MKHSLALLTDTVLRDIGMAHEDPQSPCPDGGLVQATEKDSENCYLAPLCKPGGPLAVVCLQSHKVVERRGVGGVLCHYLELQGKSHPIFAGKVESLMKVYIVCLLGCLRVISKCLGTELLEPRLALR